MKKFLIDTHFAISLSLALGSLASCSLVDQKMVSITDNLHRPYQPTTIQGTPISIEQVNNLKLGMRSSEVYKIVGSPSTNSLFHKNQWDYWFFLKKGNGELTQFNLSLWFDKDQLVKIDYQRLPSESELAHLLNPPTKGTKPVNLSLPQEELTQLKVVNTSESSIKISKTKVYPSLGD
ncbi:MAG: outer membrane protein assembly factor BamE [Gammaproteobacteria bacterium]|nr:outer membrane protein assembly factor BamE [Gammaproteobacteria bacterium]